MPEATGVHHHRKGLETMSENSKSNGLALPTIGNVVAALMWVAEDLQGAQGILGIKPALQMVRRLMRQLNELPDTDDLRPAVAGVSLELEAISRYLDTKDVTGSPTLKDHACRHNARERIDRLLARISPHADEDTLTAVRVLDKAYQAESERMDTLETERKTARLTVDQDLQRLGGAEHLRALRMVREMLLGIESSVGLRIYNRT